MLNVPLSMAAEPEWAAFAALDWADRQGELENTPGAIEAWAAGLSARFGDRPIALCLEQSRGALVYMLAKYAHLVLFPVHPKSAADYRKAFCSFWS